MRKCCLLRQCQRVKTPFVFENGAGIDWEESQQWLPDMSIYPVASNCKGLAYAELCGQLADLREELAINFTGFNELSAEKVSELTKLSRSWRDTGETANGIRAPGLVG